MKRTAKQVDELAIAARQLLLNTVKTPDLEQSCDRLRAALEPFPPQRAVTVDNERELYNIPCGDGFTCLGFDYLLQRHNKWIASLGAPGALPPGVDFLPVGQRGTLQAYAAYRWTMDRAAAYCQRTTGRRCPIELTPQLIGLEGQRVEVTDSDGQTRRFRVGKSTGWMPCHLEIYRRNNGGPAVMGAPFQSVRVLPARQYA